MSFDLSVCLFFLSYSVNSFPFPYGVITFSVFKRVRPAGMLLSGVTGYTPAIVGLEATLRQIEHCAERLV